MKTVAKLVLIDPDDKYLMMYRADHPTFGDDPDLPGGTAETGETTLVTMVREVEEEAGVMIDESQAREIYSGTEYSRHTTHYSLCVARIDYRPEITISWEHKGYEWLDRESFLATARVANDTYMHMVYDAVCRSTDM